VVTLPCSRIALLGPADHSGAYTGGVVVTLPCPRIAKLGPTYHSGA